MHPLVVRPGRLMEMDLESSEDRWMILVLMAISPSSLVLTTLGIVFGSLIFFFYSHQSMHTLLELKKLLLISKPLSLLTSFFSLEDMVVKIACTYLMVKNGIARHMAIF